MQTHGSPVSSKDMCSGWATRSSSHGSRCWLMPREQSRLPPLPRQAVGLHPDAAVQVLPWMVPKAV